MAMILLFIFGAAQFLPFLPNQALHRGNSGHSGGRFVRERESRCTRVITEEVIFSWGVKDEVVHIGDVGLK